MQMMSVLKPIAFDVVICMSQLFDYYLYTVSSISYFIIEILKQDAIASYFIHFYKQGWEKRPPYWQNLIYLVLQRFCEVKGKVFLGGLGSTGLHIEGLKKVT